MNAPFINVQARLYATLRKYRPGVPHGQSITLHLAAGSTISDLLQELGIPEAETKQVFVNGIIREVEHHLSEGDSLGIFPPIAGGQA